MTLPLPFRSVLALIPLTLLVATPGSLQAAAPDLTATGVIATIDRTWTYNLTLPDLGGKWFGTFGGSDELIDQAGMGFRVLESKLS